MIPTAFHRYEYTAGKRRKVTSWRMTAEDAAKHFRPDERATPVESTREMRDLPETHAEFEALSTSNVAPRDGKWSEQ